MLRKSKGDSEILKVDRTTRRPRLISKNQEDAARPRSTKLKKRKRSIKPLNLSTWNTTDNDEIERRRFRAKTEKLKCQPLEPEYGYFGSFLVSSKEQQSQYRVEIRSLNQYLNSCDCFDYRGNQLGTCKHIEHVLWRLQRKHKRAFKEAALDGGSRIEIYLDRREGVNRLCLLWPKILKARGILWERLQSFFNPDGTLQVDLIEAYAQIPSVLLAFKKKVRFSAHLKDVIEEETLKRESEKKNALLLKKIAQNQLMLQGLKFPLYPYQEQGMLHLVLNRRALLADEMGLGKTVQAVAACELLKRLYGIKKVLVIATASLKAEWEEQISKFTALKSLIIQGARSRRLEQYQQDVFFYLTNYEQIVIDSADIQQTLKPDVIILDEAQRIKNWQTKTANAVKQLKSPYAFVLTGTPLENRIDDIYSVVQFLDPHLFGPLFRFNREFYQLDEIGKPVGYKNLDELHRRLKPIMLRRRKEEVEGQLPERTVNHYFVSMEKEQRLRYEEYENRVARFVAQARKRPLRKEEYEKLQKWLACMRMLCDSPYILDPKCKISPKLSELKSILEELLQDKTAKIIIFSEWERMLKLVLDLTEKHGWNTAWHTGSVPQDKRREAIRRFKESSECRLFLSTDAGSLGLNLQAANIVINLDLPWNPAKLEQRIARAWRKHQTRTVRVINFVCQDSIEHRMLGLLSQKGILAKGVLEGAEELKEMALPSGRKAFMEQMESLIQPIYQSEDSIERGEAERVPIEAVNEVLIETENSLDKDVERFSQKIHHWVQEAVKAAKEGSVRTLVVIPDTVENPKAFAELMLKENSVEVIDRDTLALLERLEKNGMLTLQANVKILPKQSEMLEWRFISEERLHQANQYLAYAIRKQSVARIFMEQTFLEESLSSLCESLDAAIKAFTCLFDRAVSNQIVLAEEFIRDILVTQYQLPAETLSLWKQLHNPDKKFSKTVCQYFDQEQQKLIQHIQKVKARCMIG